MKTVVKQNNTHLIRFDRGDEVLSSLSKYCKTENIKAGSFQALGAAGEVTLSYYNLDKKEYEDKVFSEDLEIASMVGNIAVMKDDLIIHSHGVFGRQDFSTIGGHIKKLTVSATCEVTLKLFNSDITRVFDEETGLNLLS